MWEHFGVDVEQATEQFEQVPDMQAFRSLLFSKVVPNLRKLGLLTPRVRDGFEQLGILEYERYIDSATEAGELDPTEAMARRRRSDRCLPRVSWPASSRSRPSRC